jgi:tripeptide aminopeptidase
MQSLVSRATSRSLEELLASNEVRRAFQYFEQHAEQLIEEQIKICSIPASPFAERERAEYLLGKFAEQGLSHTQIDAEGNCVALRAGRSPSPLLAVSAHLDTVFHEGTDFTITRSGARLLGPGISDDGCGLIALIAIVNALDQAGIETDGSLLFVGTVGEEGLGNLRGVRHLFTKGEWAGKIDAFVSFDGPGVDRITNRALGSRRYHVELTGPGGHSWSDFGTANPVHALGRAIAKLASYPAPAEPRTTFNVGRIEGGASVNAIPRTAAMDVDLRSATEAELLRLDAYFRRAVREAVEEANSARRKGDRPLELNLTLRGERPNGETKPGTPLVDLAIEATRLLGFTPHLDQASTDSNLPISLGIPAITLGAGGSAGNSHTLDEWYDPRGRHHGLNRALLLILAIVGCARR